MGKATRLAVGVVAASPALELGLALAVDVEVLVDLDKEAVLAGMLAEGLGALALTFGKLPNV